jgi:hypothetical protein
MRLIIKREGKALWQGGVLHSMVKRREATGNRGHKIV